MTPSSKSTQAVPFLIFALFAMLASVYVGCFESNDDPTSESDIYGGYYGGYYR